MREIKFRAWNKQTKCMWWFDVLWGNFYHGDGCIGMLPIGETQKSERIQVDPHDCELMQFTGLLDENGREIYEGDIVKVTIPPWVGETIAKIECLASNGGYNLRSAYFEDEEGYKEIDSCMEFEVIGNIYENPKLVKDA